MSQPEERDFQERVSEALGSSRVEPLDGGPSRGPLDLLALRQEVRRRLRSSGGRPTDPRWEITRQVPFSTDRWQQLEELAAEVSDEERRVSPGQLAAMLVERGLGSYEGGPSSREPVDHESKHRYVFRIGEAFPPGSEVGCFLVSLSAGLNDLLFVSRLLVPEDQPLLARAPAPGEKVYLLRASSAHVWELLELLKDGEQDETVRAFLNQLPQEAREHLTVLRSVRDGAAYPELKKTLGLVRNKTWHYPRLHDKELHRALRSLRDEDGILEMGERMSTIRAGFADEALVQIVTKFTGDSEEAVGRLLQELALVTTSFVHLAQYALDRYLGELPADSVHHVPPGADPAGGTKDGAGQESVEGPDPGG